MTLEHICKFIKNHPVSLGGVLGPVLVFSLLGLLMALSYRFGFSADQASAIIAENKAPKTLELLGSISFVILLLRSAMRGPAGIPSGRIGRWFVSDLPNLVVSIAASFFGITLGSSLGMLCWGSGPLSCPSVPEFFGLGYSAILLFFSYPMALVLTIGKDTAPNYSGEKFIKGYRSICWLLFVTMLCRSLLLFIAIGTGSGMSED